MPEINNIHSIWRINQVYDKKAMKVIHPGLAALFGPERTIMELKKRCDNEMDHGSPLAGCALYVNYLHGLTDLNLTYSNSCTRSARADRNERMGMAGETEIVELIEDTWADNPGAKELSKAVIYKFWGEFDAIIEEKYGAVAREDELSDKELVISKRLALGLGIRKPRKRRAPEPEEAPPEEEEPVDLEETAPEQEEEPAPAPSSADAATANAIEEAVRKALL